MEEILDFNVIKFELIKNKHEILLGHRFKKLYFKAKRKFKNSFK